MVLVVLLASRHMTPREFGVVVIRYYVCVWMEFDGIDAIFLPSPWRDITFLTLKLIELVMSE